MTNTPARVTATPAALEFISALKTKYGPLLFFQSGGCCDGNNLAAHGLANLDNMGVVGDAIHSDQEWMRVSSISERAKLSALLLLRLASGELSWN